MAPPDAIFASSSRLLFGREVRTALVAFRRHDEADDSDRGSENRASVGSLERYFDPRRPFRPRSGRGRCFTGQVAGPLPVDDRKIGRASCRGKSVDLGGRRIIKKKKQKVIYEYEFRVKGKCGSLASNRLLTKD